MYTHACPHIDGYENISFVDSNTTVVLLKSFMVRAWSTTSRPVTKTLMFLTYGFR